MNIVELAVEREGRDGPDPDCIRRDREGRELFRFALDYRKNGRTFSTEIWATSFDEAEAHVDAIRDTLIVAGRIKSVIPAI